MGRLLEYVEDTDRAFFFDVTEKDLLVAGSVFVARNITNDKIYFNVWNPDAFSAVADVPLLIKDNDDVTPGVEDGITILDGAGGRVQADIQAADLSGNAIVIGELFVDLLWTLLVRANISATDEPMEADRGVFRFFRRGTKLP